MTDEVLKISDDIKKTIEEQNKMFVSLQEKNLEAKKNYDSMLEANRKDLAKALADMEVQKQEQIRVDKQVADISAHIASSGIVKPEDVSKDAFNKAFHEFFKSGKPEFNLCPFEYDLQKELRTDILTQGGYLVDRDVTGRIINKIFLSSPVRPYAFVSTTSSDSVVLLEDLEEASASRGSQGGTVTETSTPTFGERTIFTKKYVAYPTLLEEAIEDPVYDLEALLIKKVGDKISQLESYDFIFGNGLNAPEGILTRTLAASAGVGDAYTSGTLRYVLSGTADDFDLLDLKDLFFSVISNYRTKGNFYMNSASLSHVYGLLDGISRPMLSPDLAGGFGFKLFGRSIVTWEDLPDKDDATYKYPVIFGDMSEAYSIYDRRGIKIIRDIYTVPGKVKLHFSKRTAGGVTNFEAIKLLKSNNT